MESLFMKKIEIGGNIRPILVAGVLEQEYRGERGNRDMAEMLEKAVHQAAEEVRGIEYKELDCVEMLGMKRAFSVCSVPSPVYAAGHYFRMEQIALMPVYTELYSDIDQEIRVNLRGGQGGRMIALVNGETAFDNEDYSYRKRERVYVFEHKYTPEEINGEEAVFPLKKGRNSLMVIAGKINRGTGISFSMHLLEVARGSCILTSTMQTLRSAVPPNTCSAVCVIIMWACVICISSGPWQRFGGTSPSSSPHRITAQRAAVSGRITGPVRHFYPGF